MRNLGLRPQIVLECTFEQLPAGSYLDAGTGKWAPATIGDLLDFVSGNPYALRVYTKGHSAPLSTSTSARST